MKKRFGHAQVSMEFIMIVAISMMILLPGIYFFRNFAFESNDKILNSRLDEVASTILMKAKKMYYYGPPSKSTMQIDMPPQIGNMYIIANPDNVDNVEYYLMYTVLTSRGPEAVSYYSDIPLKAYETVDCEGVCDDCTYYQCMPSRYYSEGLKNIQVKSSDDCDYSEFCIIIGEMSPELS